MTTTRQPGKFEANPDQDLAERLYQLTLDGGQDEEMGDTEAYGYWYALIINFEGMSYILDEDSQGFSTYSQYDTERQARKVWAQLERDYLRWYDQQEENQSES